MATDDMKRYRVKPGSQLSLDKFDPDEKKVIDDKEKAIAKSTKTQERLADLQELLYAEHKHKLLIVLQGMDTSGKDSTVSLSLIHISEPTRLGMISYAVFCL